MNPKHAKPSFGALGPTKHWGRKGRVYSIKLLIYPHSNIGDTSFMVAKQKTEAYLAVREMIMSLTQSNS